MAEKARKTKFEDWIYGYGRDENFLKEITFEVRFR